ncbi:MAG: hypothetical protein Q8K32_24490 [Archangium sp.]|nr:hypothetical protein [Archangium sp.]
MKDAFALAEQSPHYDELMAFTPEASVLDYLVLLVLVTLGTGGGAALGFDYFSYAPTTQLQVVAAVLLGGGAVVWLHFQPNAALPGRADRKQPLGSSRR